MMRKGVVLLGAVLLLLPAAAPMLSQEGAVAGPFWETRPYTEWKPAELIQFFTDSPWSRSATLLEPVTQTTLGAPRYIVQWYSAQTMREALVRRRELAGQMDAQAASDFLNAPHTTYEIYLFAAVVTADGSLKVVDLDALEGMTEPDIKQGTLL